MPSIVAMDRPPLLKAAPRGPLYAAYCAVIVLQLVYVFTFNWHPDLRLPLSSALTAMHVALAAISVLLRPSNWHLLLLASTAVIVATLIPSHMLGMGDVRGLDMVEVLRRLILPLMMIWILSFPLALPLRLLWCAAVLGTLYGAYIAYSGPPLYYNINDLEPRLASLTGGIEDIHPSAKFMALQVILIDLMRRARLMASTLAWALIGLSVAVMAGYGSRSQFLFITVYFVVLAYYNYKQISVVRWLPLLSLILIITAAILALQIGSDVERWGSGRVGTWGYRIVLIMDRDLVRLLFGGGVGADNIWTPIWGWGDDTLVSHNDYLYFLTDHGLIGLLMPFFFFAALWIRSQEHGRAVLLAMAISSFFDNGYFRSPLLAVYLAIVFATALLVSLLIKEREMYLDHDDLISRDAPTERDTPSALNGSVASAGATGPAK